MRTTSDRLLDALIDSWDRNNRILVNLLRTIPADALEVRPAPDSPSVAGLFMHMHYCRLIFLKEDVPELALKLAGKTLSDDEAGPVTWDIWMDKT